MTGPRRVLWLAKGLGRGGAEKLLTTSAVHMDPARFAVDVAYLLPWKDAFVPRLAAQGLTVHCLQQRSSTDLRWVPRLRALLREQRYDVVHTHMPVPAAAARALLVRSGTALVHTEHNVWDRYRAPTYWANAATYRRNDAVVAVSQAVADSMRAWATPRSPATVEVLLHGVDHASARSGPAARAAARRTLGLPAEALVIGNVANFTPKKDQGRLLEAVAALRDRVPGLRAVLIGTGPLEEALKQQARALGIEDLVLFTGSRDDVLDLLPALDVFCLSSLHEGLSIAMLEAMASGVPPLVTAVGGAPEVLTDRVDGLLVPPADTAALTAGLLDLLTDPALRERCGTGAWQRSQEFDIERASRRLGDLYDDVLARR